jgi:predicted alpha/beta hydrolase
VTALQGPYADSTDLELNARDGFPLACRLWALPGGQFENSVALINSGAGIPSRFYDHFAAFLAQNGVPTLVYDYRGISRSRPTSLRGFKASVEEWGSKDCAAVLDWLRDRFPEAERIVVGHSIGGFVTGFVTNGTLVDKMLLISAHTGYWKDYAARMRLPMFLLWHVLMPAITRVVGYFPGHRLHLLEDLPRDVALEWAARRKPEFWWHLKNADGSIDEAFVQTLLARFAAIQARTLALSFTDDPFATDEATERLLTLYSSAPSSRLTLSAADGGGKKIGHFGFFSPRFRMTLWPRVLQMLLRSQD